MKIVKDNIVAKIQENIKSRKAKDIELKDRIDMVKFVLYIYMDLDLIGYKVHVS